MFVLPTFNYFLQISVPSGVQIGKDSAGQLIYQGGGGLEFLSPTLLSGLKILSPALGLNPKWTGSD